MCTSPKAAPQLQQTGVGCCYSVKLNLARRCERLFERHATPRRALRVCDSRPICQRQRLLFWPCTPCLTCGAWERFAFSLHRHTRFLLTVPVAPLQLTTDAVKRCARSLVLELSFASGYAVSWIVGCLCAGFGKWTLRIVSRNGYQLYTNTTTPPRSHRHMAWSTTTPSTLPPTSTQ